MTKKNISTEANSLALCKDVINSCRFRVVKHKLGGYSVEKDGKLFDGIFRLKKHAISHMNNLKKVEDAIRKKFHETISGCH